MKEISFRDETSSAAGLLLKVFPGRRAFLAAKGGQGLCLTEKIRESRGSTRSEQKWRAMPIEHGYQYKAISIPSLYFGYGSTKHRIKGYQGEL